MTLQRPYLTQRGRPRLILPFFGGREDIFRTQGKEKLRLWWRSVSGSVLRLLSLWLLTHTSTSCFRHEALVSVSLSTTSPTFPSPLFTHYLLYFFVSRSTTSPTSRPHLSHNIPTIRSHLSFPYDSWHLTACLRLLVVRFTRSCAWHGLGHCHTDGHFFSDTSTS